MISLRKIPYGPRTLYLITNTVTLTYMWVDLSWIGLLRKPQPWELGAWQSVELVVPEWEEV